MTRTSEVIIGIILCMLGAVWCVLAPIGGPKAPIGQLGLLTAGLVSLALGVVRLIKWARPRSTRVVAGLLSLVLALAVFDSVSNQRSELKAIVVAAGIALAAAIYAAGGLYPHYTSPSTCFKHPLSEDTVEKKKELARNSRVIAMTPNGLSYLDSLGGKMSYSEEEETWWTEYDGVRIGIAFSGKVPPDSSLVEYAISFVREKPWFYSQLTGAAEEVRRENKSLPAEVSHLKTACVHVYELDGVKRALIDLDGGEPYRSWRIEFRERECEGLGFDT